MRILVVDDDVPTRKLLAFVLEQVGGHTVVEAEGISAAERALSEDDFGLVTLDVMMPDGDGLELCKRIRRVSNVPIVMLSAKSNVPERVHGLKTGADDYIGKPFDPSELLARIDAVIRRTRKTGLREDLGNLRVGDFAIDLTKQSVTVHGASGTPLTRTEFRLLFDLIRAGGEVRTREELEMAIWGASTGVRPNTIDSCISDLRRKLEPDPRRPRYILTVRGKSYRLIS